MNPLFCIALDVEDREKIKRIVEETSDICDIFKVGPVSISSLGLFPLEFLSEKGLDIFLDMKFFDIPSVVQRSIRNFLGFRVRVITVHIAGGEKMVRMASETAREKNAEIAGVTMLTSLADRRQESMVVELAKKGANWGVSWVVSSPFFAPSIKNEVRGIKIISPGIRHDGSVEKDKCGEHMITFTPAEAVKLGTDMIVVGRPVVGSDSPRQVALRIKTEMENAKIE